MIGPSRLMVDLVVIDPSEGAETAEFDLLDIGEGYPLFLSVSEDFYGLSVWEYLPIACSTYQIFRFANISQAIHLGPTGFLGDNEGGQRIIL